MDLQRLSGKSGDLNEIKYDLWILQHESSNCSTQSGANGLVVDNTLSNNGSEGCFVRFSIISPHLLEVIVQIENKHEFWKQITVPYNLNDDRIEPINFWAKVGFIAPESYAEYRLLLDTNYNSNIQFFVNAARSDDGIPRAGAVNMIFKLLKIATGEDWIDENLDPNAFLEVVDLVSNSPDLISAADSLTRSDLTGFSRAMYRMVDDDDIVDVLESVAARLGKSVARSVLEKVFVAVKIGLLIKDIWHVVWSTITGSYAGTVIFTNKVNSEPLPVVPPKTPVSAPPPSLPESPDAQFTGIESPADNFVAAPNQAIHKTWRVKNTGNRIWGPEHKLVFVSGNQMGAPNAVNIPLTAPGGTVDIGIDITAPSEGGTHRGYWQLRNPQGTFFGPKLWVQLTVPGATNPQPPDTSTMQINCINCPTTVAPGQSFRPTVRVTGSVPLLQLRGDMLRNTDGNRYGAYELVAVVGSVRQGQSYDFTFYEQNPITAPNGEGVYESKWRLWQDNGWVGPELAIRFEVKAGVGANHPPNAPTVTDPGDWAVYTGNSGINLRGQQNGDPDDDAVTHYFFEIFESAQTPNSGWITSNSWTPSGLGNYGFQWRVKVRDARGAESGWSEVRHFNINDPNPQIQEFRWEWCHEPWGPSDKVCFCAKTTGGGLELKLNSANNGSDQGTWKVIGHADTNLNCNTDNDRPPNWGQLEVESGSYRVRLYARPKGEGGWLAAATQDVVVTLPPNQRPGPPFAVAPAHDEYVNSKTVTLDWQQTYRTTDYHLQVSLNSNFSTLLLDTHLPANQSEYTLTFADEHATVYWRVTATGPYGTNESGTRPFHIDLSPPTSTTSALPAVTTDTKFNVNWGGTDARSGLRWYHLQVRDGNRNDSQWSDWLVNTTRTAELFVGQAGHTYYFRTRAMDNLGTWEEWPTGDGDTYTVVDPSAIPPTTWWNSGYATKRNLIILNNDGDTIPAQYPLHLHFDSTTSPTAAEIYNASISAKKGDDLRIVYNNQMEVARYILKFTSSVIDLWFPLQGDLTGSQSDNSRHQIYYSNAQASAPPSDPNTVFLPKTDSNTMGLWHFQEGSGGTVYDSSGRSHHGSFNAAAWDYGPVGPAGSLNGNNAYVEIAHSDDFKPGAITLEAWIYLTGPTGEYPMIFNKDRYYLRINGGGELQFSIKADGGDRKLSGQSRLAQNQWYHVAATYDGGQVMRLYVNGRADGEQTNGAPPVLWNTQPLRIGRSEGSAASYFPGLIQHARVSNVARTGFPYAFINIAPSVAVGSSIAPPVTGAPDLAVLGLNTYPNPEGGVFVEALVQNQGDRETQNSFYTDLYIDHLPTGVGDYTGSAQFWVNSPIAAGATITLTTVLTTFDSASIVAAQNQAAAETTYTLYMQTDSAGAIPDADKANNILSSGVEVCLAPPDTFEGDNEVTQATAISLNQTQSHNFSSASDQDWIQFSAETGKEYTFTTNNLGSSADTYLYLYDTDGTTLLTANDDGTDTLASQIAWTAPQSATYYLLVKHWNPNVNGCGTGYDLLISQACPPPVAAPSAQIGDLDGDGDVDDNDHEILLAVFGQRGCPGWIAADLNLDGEIDIDDFSILIQYYGETITTPTPTPTPATALAPPATPKLQSPAPDSAIDEEQTITLQWDSPTHAVNFTVELFRNGGEFVDKRVKISDTVWNIGKLPPAEYLVRIQAYNSLGEWSEWGDYHFTVSSNMQGPTVTPQPSATSTPVPPRLTPTPTVLPILTLTPTPTTIPSDNVQGRVYLPIIQK